MTVDDALELLRRERQHEITLRELGEELLAIGMDYRRAHFLVAGLVDARRRRDHLAVRVDDDDRRRGRIDWEAAWCFADDETRHGSNGKAPLHLYTQTRDDEPLYVDELAIVPEISAVSAEGATAEEILDALARSAA